MANPTAYTENMPARAEALCSKCGLTLEDLAVAFGVTDRTIDNWVAAHPEFKEAIAHGRDAFDSNRVEKSLLQRALGYEFFETTYERAPVEDWDPETGEVKVEFQLIPTKKVHKQMAPDVVAQIFWLKNRLRDRWRDKQEIEHSATDLVTAIMEARKRVADGKN